MYIISCILVAIVTKRFRLSIDQLFYYCDKKDDAFVDVVYCILQARTQARMLRRRRLGGIRCCVSVYARALYYIFLFSLFLISFAASISCAFLSLCDSRNFHNFFSA